MAPGASNDDLRMAELALGVTLPPDLREILRCENGSERWYGDTFLITYGTEALVAANHEVARFTGFLVFASDGSREMIGYDLRANPPAVVMLDITAESWSDGLLQAESLDAFIERLERGEGLRWDYPYAD